MMRNLNEFMSEDDLHQLHDFFVQAEAAEINQDLANRLRALRQDEAQQAESFRSSRPVLIEAMVWLLLGLAAYIAIWLYATH